MAQLTTEVIFDHITKKGKMKWIFFEEGNEDEILLEVDAANHEEAFDEAFDQMGPQVNDWMYKLKEIV